MAVAFLLIALRPAVSADRPARHNPCLFLNNRKYCNFTILRQAANPTMRLKPVTGRENLHFHSFGGVPVIFRNGPPDGVKVFDSLRRQLK
jgi:hypothetical protein